MLGVGDENIYGTEIPFDGVYQTPIRGGVGII
jgi:hypothetical protein